MSSTEFHLGACSAPSRHEAAARAPSLRRDALLHALRTGGLAALPPEDPRSARILALGDLSLAFENAATCLARIREARPHVTADLLRSLAAWLPTDMELLAVVQRGPAERARLVIGGHEVAGEPAVAPLTGERAFRFSLTPVQVAAFLMGEPALAVDGRAPVPLPRALRDELARDLPETLNVPLTLVEF